MKLLLILSLLGASFALIGMIYWMIKSKSGELSLNANSWHVKLLHYMWDFEPSNQNACPYYWGLVCSLFVLIPYLFIRYILYKPFRFLSNWWDNHVPVINIKTPKFVDKIKLPVVPETKKQWFRLFYTKGQKIVLLFLGGICVIAATVALILLFVLPFVKFTLTVALIITSSMLFIALTILIHLLKEEWDKYHIDHYTHLFLGIFGIIGIPFVILYKLIVFIFSNLFEVISDSCPPINWIENN